MKTLVKAALATAICLTTSASLGVAHPTLQFLYQFTGSPDGANPVGLMLGSSGNFYGVSSSGGAHNNGGTVFSVTPDGVETVLYSFCAKPGCADGMTPLTGLVMDASGNLYGTTQAGGLPSDAGNGCSPCGTVFKLSYHPDKADWTEEVIYNFCRQPNCADGASARGLMIDASGRLYGTTFAGGTANCNFNGGCGTVFELFQEPEKNKWREKVLYNFCDQPNCTDGYWPSGGVIMDAGGNLYGTTMQGGAANSGTVFRIAPEGTQTVLYNFCSRSGCTDGSQPQGELIIDSAGDLYGTTNLGGAKNCVTPTGCSTVFELAPDGRETVLHRFQPAGANYSQVSSGVVADASGNLYGTMGSSLIEGTRGAMPGPGMAFEIRSNGRFRNLGTLPSGPSGLAMDSAQNLYGTTSLGGDQSACSSFPPVGCGTVFKLIP